MMVDVSYQMVLSTVQTVALIVGIAYYIMTLNYTRRNHEMTLKTRSTAIYQQTVGSFIASPHGIQYTRKLRNNPVSSFEEYVELYNNDPEFEAAVTWMFTTYDILGIYLEEGVIDVGMLAKTTPWYGMWFWNEYKPIVYEYRKRFGPSYYRNMEYAFNLMEKYFEEHPELAP